MAELPTGTVTLLFTDIEASTQLLREFGDRYADVLAEHRRILRDAFAAHGGVEVDTQGDAFFYAFASASEAVLGASEAQAALADGPVAVRMGLHTGEPTRSEAGYVGMDVHAAARVMSAGHGGQVLVSGATRAALNASDTVLLADLGEHRLKDIDEPVSLFQVGEDAFPPLRTISNTNLPRPVSSFVGRASEVEEVRALIRDGSGRLLTLTGPGGSGKTRLAIEAAAELVGEYPSGVFWVGLAALRDPALVTDTIAQTLGAKGGLVEHIGERQLLLLLDNLEQVVEAARELSSLLERCPNLKLLTTSRELLRVRGEIEYAVPPLAQPEAVQLFCARARLEPSDEIAELCRRLDSLPLAVELAAARTSALMPAQILERLSQRLDLLKGGRDADPRQQTLRATIEWSYGLLTEDERALFRHVAVFAGGCTLEAAEEVAAAEADTLQSLVEKSLLRFTNGRYWMLETIREYALERLDESSEAHRLRSLHTKHYLALAERAEPELTRGHQVMWLARLELDHDNLRASLDHALLDDPPIAARLCGALWIFWYQHGHISEGLRWIESALASGGAVPTLRAELLCGAGLFQRERGNHESAVKLHEEQLEVARNVGDARLVGRALHALGADFAWQGDPRARPLLEEGIRVLRDAGDARALAEALNDLALLEVQFGDPESGDALLAESLILHERRGNVWGIAFAKHNASFAALLRGETDRARPLAREALDLFAELGDIQGVADSLALFSHFAAAKGRFTKAAQLDGAAVALKERIGVRDASAVGVGLPGYEEHLAPLERAVAEEEFESERAQGRLMSLEQAIECALAEDEG